MTLTGFRNTLLLLLIAAYLILNYGMMLVRIPPGGAGIPVGELVLLFVLLTIHYPSTGSRLATVFPVSLLVCWWGYVFVRAAAGVPEYGLWALRDATNVIESLFLLAGFAFARQPTNLEKFFRWLRWVLVVACLYGLTYPVGELIQSISPKVASASGQLVSLFGMYTNSAVMLLWGAFYLLIYMPPQSVNKKWYFLASTAVIGFVVILFQARTIYLQILAIFSLFVLYRKDLVNKNIVALCVGLAAMTIFPLLGISVTGRLGQEVSLDFFLKHFMAIFGVAGEGVEGSARGVAQRTDWWTIIFHQLTSGWQSFVIGLGYGFPLIDFRAWGGVVVREPHNSYISFLARSGLIGLLFFIAMHARLLKVWSDAYQRCKGMEWQKGCNELILLMVYFILVWIFAIGQDAFEKPFNAIPYYFFWGVVLRYSFHLKNGTIGPSVAT